MKILTKFLVAIALVAMLIPSFTGCGEGEEKPPVGEEEEEEESTVAEDIKILSHGLSTSVTGRLVVAGIIKNVSSSTYSNAKVDITFYDASGKVLQSRIIDNRTTFYAGDSWNFVVPYYGKDPENVDSYDIELTAVIR